MKAMVTCELRTKKLFFTFFLILSQNFNYFLYGKKMFDITRYITTLNENTCYVGATIRWHNVPSFNFFFMRGEIILMSFVH